KLTDILYECGKRSTLKQILLYIRGIKRTDYETSTSKIITYRPKDLLPSEVTHHRDDHVSSMHIADVVVVFLACEKVSQLAVLVRLKDQLLKGGEPAAATHAFYPVCDVQTFEPETSVDILEAGLIRAREINLKIVLNNSADPREVSSVCVIVRRKLVDQPDYIGDGCAGRRDFASGYWPAQQQGQILRSTRGNLKDGLEHQMLDDRLPADVHYECYARTNLGDVREVLLGTDSDIRASCRRELSQLADDVQVRRLV